LNLNIVNTSGYLSQTFLSNDFFNSNSVYDTIPSSLSIRGIVGRMENSIV